jgi:3-hydroxyacyl-CoA dehydrogenase/enoyl-CoA hydratase/3-hydroxybutyryl-CoA epimerase
MLYESPRLRLATVDQLATIYLDSPITDRDLLADLDIALKIARHSPYIDLLLIRSRQPGPFLTGPDLDECTVLRDPVSLRGFAVYGQTVLERLQRLSETMPTVAFIEGHCTNAGLELALACDYRLAVAQPETLLGFNPLARGWLPCWGATQRLPRLIGLQPAVQLLLDGQMLPARAARSLGLVDHAFGPRPAQTELNWFLADLQDNPRRPPRFRGACSWWERLNEITGWGRSAIFDSFTGKLFHDPLALALLQAVERGERFGVVEGYLAERTALAEAALSEPVRKRLELARDLERRSWDRQNVPIPKHIAVVDLSETGMTLATLALRFGSRVTIWETNATRRDAGLQRLRDSLKQGVDAGYWTVIEAEQKQKDIVISTEGQGIEFAELIFSTGSLTEQQKFLQEMECFLPADCVVAIIEDSTAPASLSAEELKHPERCVPCRLNLADAVQPIQITSTHPAALTACMKLGRWFDHCGQRVHVLPTYESQAEKVIVFAA